MSSKSEAPKKPLVTLAEPQSPASEAYRALRTNLQFSSLDKPLRTILITGVDSGDGKSTTLGQPCRCDGAGRQACRGHRL